MKLVLRINIPLTFFLSLIFIALLFPGASPLAAEEAPQASDALLHAYFVIESKLQRNSFGVPLYPESSESSGKVNVDAYGILTCPYSTVVDALNTVFVLLPSAAVQHPWLLTIPTSTATINVPSCIPLAFFVLDPFIDISFSLLDKTCLP